MKYQFQIRILDPSTNKKVWRSVSPTNGKPYEYDTEEEAYRMMKMCYGNSCVCREDMRVLPVKS